MAVIIYFLMVFPEKLIYIPGQPRVVFHKFKQKELFLIKVQSPSKQKEESQLFKVFWVKLKYINTQKSSSLF